MALVEGTAGDDPLVGTGVADRIFGFAGHDTLTGLDGDDRLYGGQGNDVIHTGSGNDSAWGGAGSDTLRGGGGGDQMLDGGTGDDWILLGIERSFGDAGFGTGYGGDGNDLLQITFNDSGALFGGSGTDTARLVVYSTLFGQTTVSLAGGMVSSTGQNISFDSIERLQFFADFGDHTVTGGDLDDEIYVGTGADSVLAGAGDDRVGYRLLGAHTLDGGAGDDLLLVEGLVGASVYFIVGGDGAVDDGNLSVITGFERYHVFGQGPMADIISLGAGDDTAQGFLGDDTLFGGAGDDVLEGGAGLDVLGGGSGRDSLSGGANNDVLYGGSGDDRLIGGAGDDTLSGGANADFLAGGAGNDWLNGGLGSDTLQGGDGADVFVFGAPGSGADRIIDFEVGIDQVHIAAKALSDPQTGGFLALGAVDPARFAIGAAEGDLAQFVLVWQATANTTLLQWDADGAGALPGVVLLRFSGDIAVGAGDIWII